MDRERNLALLDLREPVRRTMQCSPTRPDPLLRKCCSKERRASYGLRAADRLLFYGPPGCGKTLTAEVIASELGLPLAVVLSEAWAT